MKLYFEIYDRSKKKIWDDFILSSKNGHFMFLRSYMDYHSLRFNDFSLMIYDERKKLKFLLPGNLKDLALWSHQGLSFGGLIMDGKSSASEVCQCFEEMLPALNYEYNVKTLYYKRMPDFYSVHPSQEDLYALFRINAKLVRRDLSSLIDMQQMLPYSKGRKWSINKARKSRINVAEVYDFKTFWELLTVVLREKHKTLPVHSYEEIQMLKEKFPENIRCFVASQDNETLAGAVIYQNKDVSHVQYMANSMIGRDIGALDYLIDHLIKSEFYLSKYFDFGISTENSGRTLNMGLIAQKEGFGARGYTHDLFEVKQA